MKPGKVSNCLASAISLTSLAIAFGLLVLAPQPLEAWWLRLLLAAGVAGTAVASSRCLLRGLFTREQRQRELLQQLAALNPERLAQAVEGAGLSAVGGESNDPAARQVLQVLSDCASRQREAEHRRSAAEIRAQEAGRQRDQLREIIAALPFPLLIVNGFGELGLVNREAIESLGIDPHDWHGRPVSEVITSEPLVKLLEQTGRRRSSALRSSEIECSGMNREAVPYRVQCRQIGAAGEQEQAGAVAVLQDISERQALQKRHAEFVSAVSHEMKTPLAGIKAYVELLADGDAEDEATRDEFLAVINSQADRLQRLIENLLNLARIEAGVVEVQKESQSLNAILEEAVHVVQPAAERKQIQLRAELSPLYLGVHADRDMILQAAINLLSNAIKYTPDSGSVTLRSRQHDEQVLFEVQDTGVGLSEEDAARVFEKFYRVKKDRNMAAGTGLGLPLAKHIVEDVHGGRLLVQSTLGKGSTFQVQLPPALELVSS